MSETLEVLLTAEELEAVLKGLWCYEAVLVGPDFFVYRGDARHQNAMRTIVYLKSRLLEMALGAS